MAGEDGTIVGFEAIKLKAFSGTRNLIYSKMLKNEDIKISIS